jgi:cation:H+ antiporter
MLLPVLAILLGLALLVWSSDRFVDGASGIARSLGLSPLIIGITIVGLGTSAPEMLVAAIASFQGNSSLGVGNAIGSNIANIALILGVTALVAPVVISSGLIRLELPILLAGMVFGLLLILDNYLSLADGLLLLLALGVVMGILLYDAIHVKPSDVLVEELADEVNLEMPLRTAIFWFSVGLIVLLISARMLVWGAVDVAQAFGISDLVIGLTIVAIGTSLPELAASIASARKGESDIAVGNVIGSNLFNLFGVMSLPGIIAPSALPAEVLQRDYPLMLALTVALFFMAFKFRPSSRNRRIHAVEGLALLAVFIGYQTWLFMGSQA